MAAFLLATVAAAAITVGAWFALDSLPLDSAEEQAAPSVRLGDEDIYRDGGGEGE